MPEAREARAVGFGRATIEVGAIDTAPGHAHSDGVEGVETVASAGAAGSAVLGIRRRQWGRFVHGI